jgi:hypothetical protein
MKSWAGRGYDPKKIEIEKVNKQLAGLKAYIRGWNKG